MKKKNKIIFIVLAILGLITTLSLYFAFNANKVEVVVATQTVRGNVPINANMLTTAKVDKGYLPANYIEAQYASDMLGRYSDVGFAAGQILTTSNVASGDGKKASIIPSGYTLLAVDIENFPQGILAGDKVNLVIGTNLEKQGRAVLTFQNILVTNVYTDIDGFITGLEVQVTPDQAQKVVYAQINGELSISLLPLDYKSEALPILNEEGFTNAVAPKTAAGAEADSEVPSADEE